jgi:hypothetical protein
MGRLDDLPAASRNARKPDSRDSPQRPAWQVIAVVIGVFGLFVGLLALNSDRLRGLLPETVLNTKLASADAALQAGRLSGAPDAALEIYRSVLEIEPDNDPARAGIRTVGEALLSRSQAALARGDLPAAKADIVLARDALQGGAALEALAAGIRAAESRSVEINDVLEAALAAQRAGRLTGGPDSAAALFQRALAADPGSGIAQKGLDEIAAALAGNVEREIAARRYNRAEAKLAEIDRLRPGYAGMPELRARLAQAREADRLAVEALLDQADERLHDGRVFAPPGDNARERFEDVLDRDRGNARAQAGLRQVAMALLGQADAALEAGDLEAAAKLVEDARKLGAPAAELRAVRTRLRELQERADIASEREAPATPEDDAELQRYLRDADAALARGDLIEPPGDNAWDLYRAALGVSGDEPRAVAGLAAIGEKARAAFAAAMERDDVPGARDALDVATKVDADHADLPALRRQLAVAYLAIAQRQLDDGQLSAAGRTVSRAREIAPDDPLVDDMAARIHRAAGG